MNPLSTGSITLQSANPSDPPIVDPQMLSHPFDRRVAIESMREAMTFLDTLKSKYVIGPEGRDDEAILVSFLLSSELSSLWDLEELVWASRRPKSLRIHGRKQPALNRTDY